MAEDGSGQLDVLRGADGTGRNVGAGGEPLLEASYPVVRFPNAGMAQSPVVQSAFAGVARGQCAVEAVANQEHVGTRGQGSDTGVFQRQGACDRAHFQIVGDNDAAEPKALAEQVVHDDGR